MVRLLKLFLLVSMAGLALSAAAQYPNKPVKIILPYAPGAGADVLTRMIAQSLSQSWKQPVIVDNKPGAGATIGTDVVAKAAPDGYTLLMTAGTMAVSPAAYPNLPYDVLKDFIPITLVAQSPYVVAVNPKVTAQTMGDLIKLGRDSPRKLNYGSPGNGTLSHLIYLLMSSRSGMQATVVPYKGTTPSIVDVLNGQVDFVVDTPAVLMQHIKGQKLKALGVTSSKRALSLPSVPTLAEAGLPDFDVSIWFGFMTPAGTPPELVHKIHDDVAKVLQNPELLEKIAAQGMEVVTMQPEEFSTYLRSEVSKWGKIVKENNIKFD